MSESVKVKYSGSVPGADTNVYTLFSTVAAGLGGNFAAMTGLDRFLVNIDHPQALAIRLSHSVDGGANWLVAEETASIAAPAAGDSTVQDFHVGQFEHFKVEVVNGGAAQTDWWVAMEWHGGHGSSA